LVSAAGAFLFADKVWAAVRTGSLPIWTALLAPATFTVFVAAYGIDRYLQVVRNGYAFARAAFQVGLAIIFLILLWPHHAEELREVRESRRTGDPLTRLLEHRDDDVRAAACELAGFRKQVELFDLTTQIAGSDRSTSVREACQQASSAIAAARPVQQ
jgi:hypothetical protein